MKSSPLPPQSGRPVAVQRWHTETPLFVLVLLASLGLWFLLALSIIGLIYVGMIGVFLFVSHVVFIAHLRGSAIRLGPEQMPELYERVETLSRQVGLKRVPVVYLMQAGGTLNALAARLFATDFVVLFSDLLEACGDDTDARDMVIGHELGHLKEGHLRWLWVLLPGLFLPFLGTAYSRAREYTCDRYGAAVCNDRAGAMRGLAILAAGGVHGRKVKVDVFARQRNDLDTGWMTIGHWLSTHPPLAHRIQALEPTLGGGGRTRLRGPVLATMLLAGIAALPFLAGLVISVFFLPGLGNSVLSGPIAVAEAEGELDEWEWEEQPVQATIASLLGNEFALQRADSDLRRIAELIEEYSAHSGRLPADSDELIVVWRGLRPGVPFPEDPFDGFPYGYIITDGGGRFELWSSGPDPADEDDDLHYPPQTEALLR